MSWLRSLLPRRVPPDPSTSVISKPPDAVKPRKKHRRRKPVPPYLRYHPGEIYDLANHMELIGVFNIPTRPVLMLLFGKSESGKSTALRSMFRCYSRDRYFVFGIILSPTAGYTGDYRWASRGEIYPPRHEVLLIHIRKLMAMWRDGVKVPPNFLILEDCTGLIGESKDLKDEFKNFLTIYRHVNCHIYVLTHHYTGTGTIFRNNVTHAFLYMSNDQTNDKELHTSFGKYLPKPLRNFKNYEDWIAERMLDHRALLFVNDLKQPYYQWYRSENAPKTGWRLYNNDESDSESESEPID